jgi:hypothetical protein
VCVEGRRGKERFHIPKVNTVWKTKKQTKTAGKGVGEGSAITAKRHAHGYCWMHHRLQSFASPWLILNWPHGLSWLRLGIPPRHGPPMQRVACIPINVWYVLEVCEFGIVCAYVRGVFVQS